MDIQTFIFWLQVITTTLNITITIPFVIQIIGYIFSITCGICGSCNDCNDRLRLKRIETKLDKILKSQKLDLV